MTRHLLLISVGPVQAFIAEARRMRDLWFGSHMLSEISKAAAKALTELSGSDDLELIFPPLEAQSESLDFQPSPLRLSVVGGETRYIPVENVGNKILAILPQSMSPKEAAKAVRTAASNCLYKEFGEDVRQRCAPLLADELKAPDGQTIWDEQLSTLIEFYAAWLPLQTEEAYANVLSSLEQGLAARKNIREFLPWQCAREGAPKSSLDGARDSILCKEPPESGPEADHKRQDYDTLFKRARLHIRRGEQLDAVGLLKRAGGEPETFVPIVNVAMVPWLRLAHEVCPQPLQHLIEACERLASHGGGVGLTRIRESDLSWPTDTFPFDASVFREERWTPLMQEPACPFPGDEEVEEGERTLRSPKWLEKYVRPVLKEMQKHSSYKESPLFPYVSCLVADGDRVGRLLGQAKNHRTHKRFSQGLSQFAGCVREVVAKHDGLLIYAGGDDVLAFLPVCRAVDCAKALSEEFVALMGETLQQLEEIEPGLTKQITPPTLSVGIGVGHIMENMSHLLQLGREAEGLAKQLSSEQPEAEQRNALALLVDKRSGGTSFYRSQWSESPEKRLSADSRLLREQFSTGKIYEVRQLLKRMPGADELSRQGAEKQASQAHWSQALKGGVEGILARTSPGTPEAEKHPERGGHKRERGFSPEEVGLFWPEEEDYPSVHKAIESWVERMLIAKLLLQSDPKVTKTSKAAERELV